MFQFLTYEVCTNYSEYHLTYQIIVIKIFSGCLMRIIRVHAELNN